MKMVSDVLCHQTTEQLRFSGSESPHFIRTTKRLSFEDLFNPDKSESDLVTSIKNYCNNYAEVSHAEGSVLN